MLFFALILTVVDWNGLSCYSVVAVGRMGTLLLLYIFFCIILRLSYVKMGRVFFCKFNIVIKFCTLYRLCVRVVVQAKHRLDVCSWFFLIKTIIIFILISASVIQLLVLIDFIFILQSATYKFST